MNKHIKKIISLTLAAVLLSACAREISPDVYTADSVGDVSCTYAGTICNARFVKVEEFEKMENHEIGAVAGGIAGGIAGANVGKGTGQVAAITGGALAGLVGGAYLEKKLRSQKGIEYVVQLDNGDLVTVVQGQCPALGVGQRVFVMVSTEGRSRVVPQCT